jgi:hypothetical protein
MSKFGTFSEYPKDSLVSAEKALLTVWRSLERYRGDLVLVGGLAVHYLTKRAVADVRGRRLHSSQELKELPEGTLRVRLLLNSLEEVERWILSMGTHATVIRPDALRERLFQATQELFGRYGGPAVIA